MELQEFISNFADQFDDVEASALSANTVFKEIDGWNSLVALSVIAMIDEEYDVTLKGNDIKDSVTIEDLYKLVNSKM